MEIEKIFEYVMDSDGSTRDITYTPINKNKLPDLINWFKDRYSLDSARNEDGIEKKEYIEENNYSIFEKNYGSLHMVWSCANQAIKEYQIFIDWDIKIKKFQIELSFFPRDINKENFRLPDFLNALYEIMIIIDSQNFFLRYENMSWEQYNENGLGVFCTRKDIIELRKRGDI